MNGSQIRQSFLRFFERRGHQIVPGAPLVPANDPSLLFTNSGMVQFKDVFLGREHRNYRSACSAQRCLRAGGKHNDLENVGYTSRHHTLFEMLGNFSFGDYFKAEAIAWAWEYLTGDEGLKLNPRQLWITIFGGGRLFGEDSELLPADEEAAEHWRRCLSTAGFSEDEIERRIVRVTTMDNFWMMGDTGPCGPCSEVFFSRDPAADRFVGDLAEHADDCVEIWNLVFMQYSRNADGELQTLPTPCVDTGMGLERAAAVVQGVAGNYESDLFATLLAAVDNAISAAGGESCGGHYQASHRVIADHLRAAAFLVVDGVVPDNEGRGYVLRRIIRRAARHAWQLGLREGCLHALVPELARSMEAPELSAVQDQIIAVLKAEESKFAETLEHGMQLLQRDMTELTPGDTLSGEVVFRLYDRCGFPPDLTADIAREKKLLIGWMDFERLMAEQRQRARRHAEFGPLADNGLPPVSHCSEFSGYEQLEQSATVLELWVGGAAAERVTAGSDVTAVLDRTPFYPEGGGQVGDSGTWLRAGETVFEVTDTRSVTAVAATDARDPAQQQPSNPAGTAILHIGRSSGELAVGDHIQAQVEGERRQAVMRNHSATHLLHGALRELLGKHVRQRGSLVEADRLRFDFSHYEALEQQQCRALEMRVNELILANTEVRSEQMSQQQAERAGALALFGEKYGEQVRVLSMGEGSQQQPYSVELCGGTHVARTGDIGLFRILREQGISSGVRRIEAVTGTGALALCERQDALLKALAQQLECGVESLEQRFAQLQETQRKAVRELQRLRNSQASAELIDIGTEAVAVGSARVLARQVDAADGQALRSAVDRCRDSLGSAVVLLAAPHRDRLLLAAGVSSDLVDRVTAGELMREFAPRLGGRGGGKREFAEGSGSDSAAWPEVARAVPVWVGERLG